MAAATTVSDECSPGTRESLPLSEVDRPSLGLRTEIAQATTAATTIGNPTAAATTGACQDSDATRAAATTTMIRTGPSVISTRAYPPNLPRRQGVAGPDNQRPPNCSDPGGKPPHRIVPPATCRPPNASNQASPIGRVAITNMTRIRPMPTLAPPPPAMRRVIVCSAGMARPNPKMVATVQATANPEYSASPRRRGPAASIAKAETPTMRNPAVGAHDSREPLVAAPTSADPGVTQSSRRQRVDRLVMVPVRPQRIQIVAQHSDFLRQPAALLIQSANLMTQLHTHRQQKHPRQNKKQVGRQREA